MMLSSVSTRRELTNSDQQDLFAAYLPKPVKPSHLYDAVATVLDTAIDSQQLGQPTHYQKPALSRDSEKNGSLKILLAEDNIVNQRVALRLLEKLGYRADVAVDGNGVLESLKRQSYDIVLMDVQMPEMDGLETSRQIARICRPEKKPWIIAMTANAMQGDREACFEAGMNDYLSKPVRMPALRAVLERASLKLRVKEPVASVE